MVPAVREQFLKPELTRTVVPFGGPYAPGTVVVDTDARYLYLAISNGMALRYAIGVGREGFEWSGQATIGEKKVWPTWIPPGEMVVRQPELRPYREGMPGGSRKSIGRACPVPLRGWSRHALSASRYPRALVYRQASVQRLHQALQPGHHRLYNRVPIGTKVIVLSNRSP